LFGKEEEDEMANLLLKEARKGFPLTPQNVRKAAFDYADNKALKHPFNKETRLAGKIGFDCFSGLSLRTPQQLSLVRAKGFNKQAVTEYFDLLRQTIEGTGLVNSPDHIYNVDETGLPFNNKPQRVVAKKGSPNAVFVTSAEKGENVSL